MSERPEFGLGYPGTELRRVLVEAVRDRRKTATAGLHGVFEDEGFESVEEWHAAHERFFERTIAPDTLIDAVRFRVVERL